jgi:hypothetical protein
LSQWSGFFARTQTESLFNETMFLYVMVSSGILIVPLPAMFDWPASNTMFIFAEALPASNGKREMTALVRMHLQKECAPPGIKTIPLLFSVLTA